MLLRNVCALSYNTHLGCLKVSEDTETIGQPGHQIWSLWPVRQKVKAPAGFKTTGGWSQLIDLLNRVKVQQVHHIHSYCFSLTMIPEVCAVRNWKLNKKKTCLNSWEFTETWNCSLQSPTVQDEEEHCGSFPFLPLVIICQIAWATPFCFTQTKKSSFCFCVLSLSQQSIWSTRVYLVGGFLF